MKKLICTLLALTLLLCSCGVIETPPNETETSGETEKGAVTLPPEELTFSGMNDPRLLTYLEDTIYSETITALGSEDFVVENVSASYVSKEYLEEVAYNSQANIYFGYSLDELNEQFAGDRYVFTLGEDGQTTVKRLEEIADTDSETILRNVVVGAGVILICVTATVITAYVAPTQVHLVFAASALTAQKAALEGAAFSAFSAFALRTYQTGDVQEGLQAAALKGSEGFMCGAIVGAASGAAGQIFLNSAKKIPTPTEAEKHAFNKYGGKMQTSYQNGKEVARGTAGSTRPDLVVDKGTHLEAIEIKRYALDNSNSISNLCSTLKKQVSDRIVHMPENTTQRIVLNVEGRSYSKETIDNAVRAVQDALDNIYPDIPIDVMA